MDALQPRLLLFPAVLLPALALSAALAIAAGEVQPAVGVNEATAIANWHQAAFDSAHTAHNRLETVLTPSNVGQLTQVWASQVGTGALYASPVVARGKVFIGSGDGRMYAFDAATGATLWIGEQQDLFFVDSAAAGHDLFSRTPFIKRCSLTTRTRAKLHGLPT
jgi:glucose dehydrogenase